MTVGHLHNLRTTEFNIILGSELARKLNLEIGDKVTLVAPQANVTPAGVIPRLKRFTLTGIFEVGMHEFDTGLALNHNLNPAMDFLALVIIGFCPEIKAICLLAASTTFGFCSASPRPMFKVTFLIIGI